MPITMTRSSPYLDAVDAVRYAECDEALAREEYEIALGEWFNARLKVELAKAFLKELTETVKED